MARAALKVRHLFFLIKHSERGENRKSATFSGDCSAKRTQEDLAFAAAASVSR
jgi:hypothetical protein